MQWESLTEHGGIVAHRRPYGDYSSGFILKSPPVGTSTREPLAVRSGILSVAAVRVAAVAEQLTQDERLKLAALRYAVNEESGSYIAIMRLFTGGISGFLSDLSAAEVAERLGEQGLELDVDTVDARLSYLVEHGNLARSPRETEARSVREYLSNRARYQLSQRGELVHRQVEELLGHVDTASEVSSEMLGGVLGGLSRLDDLSEPALAALSSEQLARDIATLFAQFQTLVDSTRQFYSYLSQVLTRFDLDRDEFQAFKGALLDYLQRFVDEVSRYLPQIADRLVAVEPRVPAFCARANAGQRLIGIDGTHARRSVGLDPGDWDSMHAWFIGSPGRAADADNVRGLATQAMRALLVNLRRIAGRSDREQSRYADLLKLARWFDDSDDEGAHALWASAFGLYSARHLGFLADNDADPVPGTKSWWHTPVAEVPVSLRKQGERRAAGRTGAREDFSATKAARLADRRRAQNRRASALREIAERRGDLGEVRLSEDGRNALLDLYTRALSKHGGPLRAQEVAVVSAEIEGDTDISLSVRRIPGRHTVIVSPQGRLVMRDLTLGVNVGALAVDGREEAGA